MAAQRKPRPKKLKFELTKSGVAGIGIVTFCLFLWMFLLGVWVGQTLLLPSYETKGMKSALQTLKTMPQIIRADKKPVKKD